MKFYKTILILISLFWTNLCFSQLDTAGVVFVTNDYRNHDGNEVVVKWIANNVYYPNGFHVYRKTEGTNNWEKLTNTPLNVKDEMTAEERDRSVDATTLFDMLKGMDYSKFQSDLTKAFVAIEAIEEPFFAEILGVVFYDNTAVKGVSYRYKVEGVNGDVNQLINISPKIKVGKYVKPKAPQNLEVVRERTSIKMKWSVEDLRYFGVNIYRKSKASGDFVKITETPRHVQKMPNEDNTWSYPEVCFEDVNIYKGEDYEYKFSVIDYFGQESEFSKVHKTPYADLDPPLAPFNLKGDVHILDLELIWEVNPTEDLAGFNVYRREKVEDELERMNKSLLSADIRNYQEKEEHTGGVYFTVASVDKAGNEAFSPQIFVDVHDIIPPAIPQNVQVTPDTGKIVLTWSPVEDKDLAGYLIHRSISDENNEDNLFIVINKDPIMETSYTEYLPKNVSNKFVYTVVAVDTNFNNSQPSEISVVRMPDVSPPQPPFLKNIHTEHNDIRLEWLSYHDPDLKQMIVYRSNVLDSANYKEIGRIDIADALEYEDRTVVDGAKYFYHLRSIDNAGNISEPSNVYEGMSYDGYHELHEENSWHVKNPEVVYNKSKGLIRLTWEVIKNDDLKGVIVYKGNSPNTLRPITGLQHDELFDDKDIQNKKTYYYSIRSYDKKGHRYESDIFKITVDKK